MNSQATSLGVVIVNYNSGDLLTEYVEQPSLQRPAPGAAVDHLGSAMSNKYPSFAVYHGHRNLLWTFVKNTPLLLLLLKLYNYRFVKR